MTDDPAQRLYKKRAREAGVQTDVDSMAAWAFGLSLVGLWLLIIPVAGLLTLLIGPLAAVLGVISLARIRNDTGLRGRGFAAAAIILGILSLVLAIAGTVFFSWLLVR